MAAPCAVSAVDKIETSALVHGSTECPSSGKRQQFGNRFLIDPSQVFQHNAWDNVEWTEEQEAAARHKVQENSQPLSSEKQEQYDVRANEYWNDFYKIHQNRFFKDRHWLFTEFPELAQNCQPRTQNARSCHEDADENACRMARDSDVGVTAMNHAEASSEAGCDFPGAMSTYRIMEVGCGVGNTVFPILKTNNHPGLFVYCCDFSSTAVELVKTNEEYDLRRCFAFVHDLSDAAAPYPVPKDSLDVIVLIFVLSALHPDKMQMAVSRLAQLLKPGGVMLLRDYGRYDMAQLRFKKGRCLSENFYVRGDGTRVYFFTQDELHNLFTNAALEKVQNLVDRRLQVNRGKQLTMHRVWIQCKYRKALGAADTGASRARAGQQTDPGSGHC